MEDLVTKKKEKQIAKEEMLCEVQLIYEAEEQERGELQKEKEALQETGRIQGMMDLIQLMDEVEELDCLISRISEGELYLENEAYELAKHIYLGKENLEEAIQKGQRIEIQRARDDYEDVWKRDWEEDYLTLDICL